MSTMLLESGVTFHLYTSQPNTPDMFGNAGDWDFGATTTTMAFTPEGSLVNQLGVPINGTVYLGRPTDTKTARAVTVFGTTGRIRGYRWLGGFQWDIP